MQFYSFQGLEHIKQGNQRWQIPRPATCQCLATFTPLKSNILIFFRDVISLLARVFILLIVPRHGEAIGGGGNIKMLGVRLCVRPCVRPSQTLLAR